MNFLEAIDAVKELIPELQSIEYDGIVVKRLETSNTLDKDRTTNQTHIAITGEQMDIFPFDGSIYPLLSLYSSTFPIYPKIEYVLSPLNGRNNGNFR